VRLARGVTNALSPDMVTQLTVALRLAHVDTSIRSIVIASANDKFFSMGLDLAQIIDLPRSELAPFIGAFNRMCLDLYTSPKPTVAAITGHATAGGCILALCCDYRLIAEGRKLMGLNEIKLGVPVPLLAYCILQGIVGWRNAREVIDSGEFYAPASALLVGLVDRVLALGDVIPKAVEWAETLGAHPKQAFATNKATRTRPVEEQVRAAGDSADRQFLDCWYSETAQARLREAAAKF
jgi:enoyl-CoA hydratase/carnithine racemase